MMFVFSLLTLTEFYFYFYQAQRVCSQWTQTGKPTNDFSMLLQLEPSTISWSIQRIYLYLGWSNVYNIHSLIHCCSTLELIIFVKNKSKTNPTGNSFPTSVHWFFVSYLMCYQEAFNVETVHVKIYIWCPNNFIRIFGNLSFARCAKIVTGTRVPYGCKNLTGNPVRCACVRAQCLHIYPHTSQQHIRNLPNINILSCGQKLQCWSYNVYGSLGGHWPRGSTGRRPVRKKRPAKRVFFFWFPLSSGDASSRSGLTDFSPSILQWIHSTEASASPGHAHLQVKNGHTIYTHVSKRINV